MSIQTELSRIINAKAAIKTAIEGKGVTVPEATLLDGMASLIEGIEAGGGQNCYVGTVTLAEDSTTITIEHNLGTKSIYYLVFAQDNSRPTNAVHATMKYFNSTSGYVTYWSTYPPHNSAHDNVYQTDNSITFSNSNVRYIFTSGRTYTVAAWKV